MVQIWFRLILTHPKLIDVDLLNLYCCLLHPIYLLFIWRHQLWLLTIGKRLYCDKFISTLPFFRLLSSHSFRQYIAGYSKSKWNLLANNLFDSFSTGRWSIPSMQTLWTSLPLKWKLIEFSGGNRDMINSEPFLGNCVQNYDCILNPYP